MNAAERKRMEDLERRVRELEARPPQVIHYPVFTPYVPVQPAYPAPAWPPIFQPWCSSGAAVKAADAVVTSTHKPGSPLTWASPAFDGTSPYAQVFNS